MGLVIQITDFGFISSSLSLPISVGNSSIDVINEKVFLSSVGGDGIEMLTAGGTLRYDDDGILNLPSNVISTYDSSAWIKATNALRIQAGNTIWKFYEASPGYYGIEFPDSTYQYTAFPGFNEGIVSSSQQIQNYNLFAVTSSANTFYGNQTISNGYVILSQVSQSLNFSDDAAAAIGGVPLGGLYRNGNFIAIRIS